MKYCVKCGKEIVEGQKFCRYCGTPVQEEGKIAVPNEPDTVVCSHCGKEVSADRIFCTECGYRLDKKKQTPGSVPGPTPGSAPGPTPDPTPRPNPDNPEPPKPVPPSEYGRIANDFIVQQTLVTPGTGGFKCDDENQLCSRLSVPVGAGRYLAIDTTMMGKGKNGFVISDLGIYSKQLFGNPQLIPWVEFLNAPIKREEGKNFLQISFKWPNKIEYTGSQEEQNHLLQFFQQLQEYMKHTIEMGR